MNNPTYEAGMYGGGLSGFTAENPVFSEDTMEKAAPLSAGNPGFIGSDDAPPEYSNFMAKEKEAEVRHSVIQIYATIRFMLYYD